MIDEYTDMYNIWLTWYLDEHQITPYVYLIK